MITQVRSAALVSRCFKCMRVIDSILLFFAAAALFSTLYCYCSIRALSHVVSNTALFFKAALDLRSAFSWKTQTGRIFFVTQHSIVMLSIWYRMQYIVAISFNIIIPLFTKFDCQYISQSPHWLLSALGLIIIWDNDHCCWAPCALSDPCLSAGIPAILLK